MALTQVSRGLLSTSIVDNGNAMAITIDSSENVTFSGTVTADQASITGGVLELGGEGVSSGYINSEESLYINADSNNTPEGSPIVFGRGRTGTSGGFEDMRLDGSGNLLVGKTSATTSGDGLWLSRQATEGGRINFTRGNNTSTHTNAAFYTFAGTAVGSITTTTTSTSYGTSSDQRLKENIADADDAGSKVDAIQVRKFDWKVNGSHQDYGMIAQELQAVAPEAVSPALNPEDMLGVDYSKLVPMLVKEIQSLRARVAQLENT